MDNQAKKRNDLKNVLLGVLIGLLLIFGIVAGYFIISASDDSADEFSTDLYHRYTYAQAVKQCGERFLNVKWPFFTASSWQFAPYENNGQKYVVGTCKVTAEGNPEKIDVACVFQIHGRTVENAFFAAGQKVYYDGINYSIEVLNSLLRNWEIEVSTTTPSSTKRIATQQTISTTHETTVAPTTVPISNALSGPGSVGKTKDGRWALLRNGTVDQEFTGVASNTNGSWYIENGYVNFNFSGKVVFKGVTYDVENGRIV